MTRRGRIVATVLGAVIYAWMMVLSGWQLGEVIDQAHPVECAREDSPGPCVWHANLHGNGKGRSFVVGRNGAVAFLEGDR